MRQLLLLFLFNIFLISNAQSIKVKKGNILVNKQKIGRLELVKEKDTVSNKKIKYYKIFDNNNKHVFNIGYKILPSPLYHFDKEYLIYAITYIPTKKVAAINDPNFYLGKKKVASFLYDNSLLDENGVNMDGVEININLTKSIPKNILKEIEKEKEKVKDGNYIVNRVKSDPIFLEYLETVNSNSFLKKNMVTVKRYAIYQGLMDPVTKFFKRKSLIGYLLIEYPQGSTMTDYNYKDLYILNIKDIAVAHVNTFNYHMYFPYKEIPYKVRMNSNNGSPYSDIFKTKNIFEKAKKIIADLIKNNRL